MTPFDAFLASQPTVDALDGFDRRKVLDYGIRPTVATEWEMVHAAYFGATKWTAQQRIALEKARAMGHELDRLTYIEKRLKPITDERTRWALRHELLDVFGSFARLKSKADEIVTPPERKAPSRGISFSAPKNGMCGIYVSATERFGADLEHRLRLETDGTGADSAQMYDALEAIVSGEAGGVVPAAPAPEVIVPLDEHTKILRGEGDDTLLQLADGTTMTGAEYLSLLSDEIGVSLFHPREGAVNCYRGQRFANTKQRILARAMSPTCAVPGCRHGATACEIHHIVPWSKGGETNINNLIPLCRYHNRVNDDERERRRRGYVTYMEGRPVWISPRGYPVPARVPGAMELLFGPVVTRRMKRAPGTSTSS